MLKDVEGKDPVENRVTKWKMVCVAHNIGVPKDLVLKLDAVRVTLDCSSCSNIQNEVAPLPQDLLKFKPDRVAGALGHDFHFFVHKNRDTLMDAKLGLALATLDGRGAWLEVRTTARTGEDRSQALRN